MSHGSDPARLLLRALQRSATEAGLTVAMTHQALTPWASATFTGGQHDIAVTGDGIGDWLDRLDEADLPMRGCFVAGVEVGRTADGAMLTVLVLEE